MEMKQKIRVLRKWNRRLEKEEALSYEMSLAMGSGYGMEYLNNYCDERRYNVLKKLGVEHQDIRKYMEEYEEKEMQHIPMERLYMGEMPKVRNDLSGFHHLTWEPEDVLGSYWGRNI